MQPTCLCRGGGLWWWVVVRGAAVVCCLSVLVVPSKLDRLVVRVMA